MLHLIYQTKFQLVGMLSKTICEDPTNGREAGVYDRTLTIKGASFDSPALREVQRMANLYYNPSFSCLSRRSLKGEGGFTIDYF